MIVAIYAGILCTLSCFAVLVFYRQKMFMKMDRRFRAELMSDIDVFDNLLPEPSISKDVDEKE